MSKISTLKTQAKHLVRALSKQGIKVTHAQALEGIAAQYGFDNWDALAGVVNAKPPKPTQHTIAEVDFLPSHIWVEQSNTREYCDVSTFDVEALALWDDPAALNEYLATTDHLFDEKGMDRYAIHLFANRQDFNFTFNDLKGLHYEFLAGKHYWYAPAIDTYLEIEGWAPAAAPDTSLKVPTLEKSVTGVSLVVLRSGEGAEWDAHVLVPAHLDATAIATKLSAEILRLKEVDRARGDDEEYTETDLVAYAAKLGCHWVVNPTIAAETWD